MRVGIVLHPFGNSSRGLEQYTYETARSIVQTESQNVLYTIFVRGDVCVPNLPKDTVVVHLPKNRWFLRHLWKWRNEIDTFIFFTERAPFFLWKKSIIVFFDAASVLFGPKSVYGRVARFITKWWAHIVMRFALHVVTISEASRSDLYTHYHVPLQKITVIYPGYKSFCRDTKDKSSEEINIRPFFIYVGPLKERKNVLMIIRAFREFSRRVSGTHDLYLVGREARGRYAHEVLEEIENSEHKNLIYLKKTVGDTELESMYAQAAALVYPSLLEGFGLPILEALSCGCPVITSHTTSTKEVAGAAGVLVDPQNVDDITKAMIQVTDQMFDRNLFRKRAREQCAKFSWEKSGIEWRSLIMQLPFER